MKKIQSMTTRLAFIIGAVAVIAMPIMASAKNSVKKVTGSAVGASVSTSAQFAMNITEGLSASVFQSDLQQNAFTYSNADGLAYSIEVRFSNFADNAVWFTGQIISSSDSSLLNQWLVVKVVDNGQSKDAPDTVSMRIVYAPSSAFNMVYNQNQYLYDSYEITAGNLMVH